MTSFFEHRDGVLHAEDVPLRAIAETVGAPVHVYAAAELRHAADEFAAALSIRPRVRVASRSSATPAHSS